MSDIAIRVDHLGKGYRIGAQQQRQDTLSDVLVCGLIPASAVYSAAKSMSDARRHTLRVLAGFSDPAQARRRASRDLVALASND